MEVREAIEVTEAFLLAQEYILLPCAKFPVSTYCKILSGIIIQQLRYTPFWLASQRSIVDGKSSFCRDESINTANVQGQAYFGDKAGNRILWQVSKINSPPPISISTVPFLLYLQMANPSLDPTSWDR
jgi:hypothetical protein